MKIRCIFCGAGFQTLKEEVEHLATAHTFAMMDVAGTSRQFFWYNTLKNGEAVVCCICRSWYRRYEKYASAKEALIAHLEEEGGSMAAHLEREKEAEIMNKIAWG